MQKLKKQGRAVSRQVRLENRPRRKHGEVKVARDLAARTIGGGLILKGLNAGCGCVTEKFEKGRKGCLGVQHLHDSYYQKRNVLYMSVSSLVVQIGVS